MLKSVKQKMGFISLRDISLGVIALGVISLVFMVCTSLKYYY